METLDRIALIRASASPEARWHDIKGLVALSGKSESWLRQKMREGTFPKPLNIGGHPSWRESDWIEFTRSLVE